MATTAHCIFCFEVLAANLENRPSLSLAEVESLWDEYQNRDSRKETSDHDDEEEDYDDDDDAPQIPTITTMSDDDDDDDDESDADLT